MEYYSAIKTNEIMPFAATWIDLEIVTVSEVSQTEKDKYHDIAYMWNLKEKIQMNLNSNMNRQAKNCKRLKRMKISDRKEKERERKRNNTIERERESLFCIGLQLLSELGV